MADTGALAASLDTSAVRRPTDVWAWRPDAATVVTGSGVMTVVGGVGRKELR